MNSLGTKFGENFESEDKDRYSSPVQKDYNTDPAWNGLLFDRYKANWRLYSRCLGTKTSQNTISSEIIKIYYPFHPLYGLELKVLSRKKPGHKDGTIKVKTPNGFCKEVPIWIAKPQSTCFCISRSAEISLKAITRLIELLECSIEDLKF
jgi:hypothetical protein